MSAHEIRSTIHDDDGNVLRSRSIHLGASGDWHPETLAFLNGEIGCRLTEAFAFVGEPFHVALVVKAGASSHGGSVSIVFLCGDDPRADGA